MGAPVLITQCLQVDFTGPLGPHDPLPNYLHIGWEESKRLLGEDPAEGPVARFMDWAYRQGDTELQLIHIRDWHDPQDPAQKPHLEHFGPHCLKGSRGAGFVFQEPPGHGKNVSFVESPGLNDFIDTPLPQLLAAGGSPPQRFGILGVWTDVKISFLAYELRTRFPEVPIALCSALVASRSRTQHHWALDSLAQILQIEIFHTVGAFADFLAGAPARVAPGRFAESLSLSVDKPLADGDEAVLRYLYRHSAKLAVRRLDGGFSGNTVLGAESVDPRGFVEAPHVVKIGPREPMGQERLAFEKVENVLGNHAPRIADFVEIENRGGIKYRYASMGGGKGSTFQKTYMAGAPLSRVKAILDSVFLEQLSSFAKAAKPERVDVLGDYQFSPKWAPSIREKVRALDGRYVGDELELLPGIHVPHPGLFYENGLSALAQRAPDRIPWAMVHGDLNGANIILDGHDNVWLIDFFHTHMGHALKDLIKLENDILFIYTPLPDEAALRQAFQISQALAGVEDLAEALPEATDLGLRDAGVIRAWETVKILRSYYPAWVGTDRGAFPQRVGHLRYAMHTLGFDESNAAQRTWALYSGAVMAQAILEKDLPQTKLRLDLVPIPGAPDQSLALTILPGRADRGRNLAEDLAVIKSQGITHIGVLLTDEEMVTYGVPDLLERYRAEGLTVLKMPFMDQRVPSNPDMDQLLNWADGALAKGAKLLFHCLGGLGRSGLAAACLLKRRGQSTREALEIVRHSRSPRAVETPAQEKFLDQYRPVRYDKS